MIEPEQRSVREMSELLMFLSTSIEEDTSFSGMCASISKLSEYGTITTKEYFMLNTFIIEHTPFICKVRMFVFGSAYYWTRGFKFPRLQYLDRHVNKQLEIEMCND